VHLDLAGELTAALAPGGRLIAGGIIRDQREPVVAAFAAAGARVIDERGTEEWVVLLLQR
jgi:ribosomal protein L11 methyltransferase